MTRPRRLTLFAALCAVLAVLGLGLLRWFDQHPVTIGGLPVEAAASGAIPERLGARSADVLLVVDSSRIADSAAAGSFAGLDFSFGWLAPLEAEFGPVEVLDVANPPITAVPGRLIVITSSVDGEVLERITAGANKNATVFVDAPADGVGWGEFRLRVAGLKLEDGATTAPCPAGDVLPAGVVIADEDRAAVAAAAWPRPAQVSALVPSDFLTKVASKTSPPLFFDRNFPQGRVVSSALPLGRLFATALLGAPTDDDFTLRERHGDYPDIIEPDDLVEDARLRENESPFVDVWMHALAALLDPPADTDLLPIPRLAWFPAGSRGVFLMTHDEDLRGGKAMVDLAAADHRAGIRSTHFVVANPRITDGPSDWPTAAAYPDAIRAQGGALALHWWQLGTPHGFWKIEPVQWIAPLAEQLEWFERIAPAADERRVNRDHMLQLRPHWSETFRILAAGGVALDSTFGANKGRGYLFGSARPYRALDRNGLPLPILELPFESQEDWGGADAAYFDRLFAANAARHRGALVSIFHPPSVLKTPTDPALIEHVRNIALSTGHASMTMQELLAFWSARRGASVKSGRSDAGQRELRVDVTAPAPGLALLVPLGPRDATDLVSYDPGVAAPTATREVVAGHPFLNIPLRVGPQRLAVRFRRN